MLEGVPHEKVEAKCTASNLRCLHYVVHFGAETSLPVPDRYFRFFS